jgi:DNA repair protein RecN (Recombination protein N)
LAEAKNEDLLLIFRYVILDPDFGLPMIKFLKIKNIALISSLELELENGLSLFTGETGAGKSILIDAVGLILGNRASNDLIRTGAENASVEAIVEDRTLKAFLGRHGLPDDGDEIILRRELSSTGKGRASVNGALVPVSLLRELAPEIASIHGQHEPQGLLATQTQQELLDAFAGLSELAQDVAERYRTWRNAETALATWRRDRREREARRETLQFQLNEIDQAQLIPNEEDKLRQEKALLANAERLAQLSEEAYVALYEDEHAVLSRLRQIERHVDDLAAIDLRFGAFVESRQTVRAHLEDLAFFLRDYRSKVDASPSRLEEVENRLALVERLKRKYGASVSEVIAFADRCRNEIGVIASPEERERALEAERVKAFGVYREKAVVLSQGRRDSARELARRIQLELATLAMEKTRFNVRFTPEVLPEDSTMWTNPGEHGPESVEFMLSPNPGEELRSLARIASGGELSRIMLALKSVADLDSGDRTMIFDEVDAGIGGRMAEVVGNKLKAIARRHQVLCVTHLPQISALADHHYLVSKHVEGSRTLTKVRHLNREERIKEIARMLGGSNITSIALQHAREMLIKDIR